MRLLVKGLACRVLLASHDGTPLFAASQQNLFGAPAHWICFGKFRGACLLEIFYQACIGASYFP
jgi:hypothetical protein